MSTQTPFDQFSVWNENQLKRTEQQLVRTKATLQQLEVQMPNILVEGAKIWAELTPTQKAGVAESDPAKAERLENLSIILKEQAEATAAATATATAAISDETEKA